MTGSAFKGDARKAEVPDDGIDPDQINQSVVPIYDVAAPAVLYKLPVAAPPHPTGNMIEETKSSQ
jgi:hypothetical protein